MNTAYINGRIYTVDSKNSTAQAMLVKDGKIELVGTNEDIYNAAVNAETIDLEGKCVLPAFFEAHAHISAAVSVMYDIPLGDLKTPRNMHRQLKIIMPDIPTLNS